jgi:hypothetical protein
MLRGKQKTEKKKQRKKKSHCTAIRSFRFITEIHYLPLVSQIHYKEGLSMSLNDVVCIAINLTTTIGLWHWLTA